MFNLIAELPRAILWAETQAAEIRAPGVTLNEEGLATARRVGVVHPEHIRVLVVPAIPVPDDPEVQVAAVHTGLLGPNTAGLTLGYSIFITGLIQSVKLNGQDLHAYLKHVLTRIPTQSARRLEELLPHRWEPSPEGKR